LSKLDFDIAALQETQLESGTQKSDYFTLFNPFVGKKDWQLILIN
jgi:hypothetical protein